MSDNSPIENWMSYQDNDYYLSSLAIPGTHDSWTYSYDGIVPGVVTQTYSVTDQLKMGVRFFDLRLKYDGKTFWLYHNYFSLTTTIEQVVQELSDYLASHPSECIILSIKDEAVSNKPFGRPFYNQIIKNTNPINGKDAWYTGNSCPTLGEVRGQIVAFRRWSPLPGGHYYGVAASPKQWPQNGTGQIRTKWTDLYVQDYFDVEGRYTLAGIIDKKFAEVKNLCDIRYNSPTSNSWFINFLSAKIESSNSFYETPKDIALGNSSTPGVNSLTWDYIRKTLGADQLYMVYAIDFVDPKFAGNIVWLNQNTVPGLQPQ